MRRVVVNTTPLIALAEIGELHILKDLYERIEIPNAVFEEIKSEPAYWELLLRQKKKVIFIPSDLSWISLFTMAYM